MADHAAVTFLVEQVTEVIKGYADLITGSDREFDNLKEDVEELKTILEDTANIWTEDDTVRLIKNQIRGVVYEVEDAIDSWLTELKVKKRSRRSPTDLSFAKMVMDLRQGQVKEVLEKARMMKRNLLQFVRTSKEEAEVRESWADPPIRQAKVVGLKDEEEKIKSYLMKDQSELDIIPIIGMPGLGKTTLACKIYNDELIRYEFPIRIWVHFSQRFNSTDVLIEIMRHFTANMDELHSMGNRDLCKRVHTRLSRDKFLLVVDNVWKTEQWDELKVALPYNNGTGKVLITSRDIRVGRHVQRITKPHQQRYLNSNESWELLQLEVFGDVGRSCPEKLQGIGRTVAEKCCGIPMTIVFLGGVLKDQYLSLKSDALVSIKWSEVSQDENLALEYKKREIVEIVTLSYRRLPERLRECFLYLGVFPAGYDIQAWTLMQLWIAEGFIQPDGKLSLEKIAEENLNYLISANLLMVREMNVMGEVKVCRVHDVIRMFCTDEAEKENLFNDVKLKNIVSLKDSHHIENAHRVCLHSDLNKVLSMRLKGPRVRSFLSFQKDAAELDPENVSTIFRSFPNLRVLQSKTIKFKNFPPRLIMLNLLRYIVLCVSDLEILPDQISLLWNLQTIIVHTNSKSLIMRASLWKMVHLRHLKTKAAIILEKEFVDGDQGGENLQTLNRLSPESIREVSQRATKLKTLGVQGNLVPLFEDMPLGKLDHLEKLKLYQVDKPKKRLRRFPDVNCFPPNLKRLTLSNTFLEWKHMSTLANIHGLEVLKLKEDAFTGISWEAEKHDSFGNLQALHMLYLDLVVWTASDSTFPCLWHLELKACDKLHAIPGDKLRCLESLDIDGVRKRVADSAKNLEVKLKLGDALIA